MIFTTLRNLFQQNKSYRAAYCIFNINKHSSKFNNKEKSFKDNVKLCLISSIITGFALNDIFNRKNDEEKKEGITEAGERRMDLPVYRSEDIMKHDNRNSFWVIYRHGVYDLTEFLPTHPGGDQILNAGGLSIEPFWNVYGMHKTPQIYALLEKYRIGNLHEDDVVEHKDEELWAKEPYRDPRLVIRTSKPFNAEIQPKYQIEHFDTPSEIFYVRQHMPVPDLDPATHKLKVCVGEQTFTFTMDQLDQMPQVKVRAALMCAGNRRSEMNAMKEVKGINWAGGAVGNALWEGVPLRELLLRCGVDAQNTEGKHVIFLGTDVDATGERFGTSIPLDMALDTNRSVLVARRMNGAPLPPDHGRPLRGLVPGAPAVRSVKWLDSIIVSEVESSSHWHKKDYRAFNPSTTWETADFEAAPPVYSLPVTSYICYPENGNAVRVIDGCVQVRGYAYSGGGAKILRVDVSSDQGRTWIEAPRLQTDAAPAGRHYSWALWDVNVPVNPGQKEVELWVKATDSNFNTQPERFDHIWNIRGIIGNAYHRIVVKLV